MFKARNHFVALLVALTGCGDDDSPGGMLGSTGHLDGSSTSGGADETADGADETADETGDSGNPGAPCEFEEDIGEEYDFEAPSAAEATLVAQTHCNFDEIFGEDDTLETDEEFLVWIYHPQDALGDWPDNHPPFPVVFMSPGGGHDIVGTGLNPHRYLPMFEALARTGFVVIAVEPPGTWSSGKRRAALACAMIWARDDPSLSPHLADVMAILGHSRGGGGAYLLTRDILAGTNLPTSTSLDEWSQCALVTIAQSFDEGIGGDPTDTNLPITDSTAPPFLALQGAIDEDTRNEQIAAFDNRYSEALIDAQTSQPEQNDELLLLVYGESHNSWGGTNLGGEGLTSPYYVPALAEHRPRRSRPETPDIPGVGARLWTDERWQGANPANLARDEGTPSTSVRRSCGTPSEWA